jgi:hypothetical protein
MKKRIISMFVTGVVLGSSPAYAVVSDAEFAELKNSFAAMSKRISDLEAQNSALRKQGGSTVPELGVTQTELANVKQSASANSWADSVKLKGDFRYRYEGIDVEGADSRTRNRIRARTELNAKLADNLSLGLAIASGGNDPVSSNQTLGGGGSSKGVNLDLAYAKWNATDELYLQAGKFKNPMYSPNKSALMWDGDWRPEGIGAGWKSGNLFANFIGNFLESDTKSDKDAFAWGLQGGVNFNLGSAKMTTSLGYYDFPTAGNTPFFDDDFFGNSSIDGVYQYDYEMLELGVNVALNTLGKPLSLFGHFVQNQDAEDFDSGYQIGAKLGKVGNKGSWEASYFYQDLEADAVLGLLSDSDFAGGGTDGKGHVVKGAYGISDEWKLSLSWFVNNEFGEKNLADEGGEVGYDRFQLDMNFKF